ncbi:MAG: alpha/beta hydrolase [Fusobacteria bacterium]|nr:alpha/beta hydrolase [Fusobacteriota bacterium]
MQIVEEFIEDIPILMVYKSSEVGKFKGSILFFHGLESDKENYLEVYKRLASENFLVVGVDNRLHGKRRPENYHDLFNWDTPDVWRVFFNAVYQTACDVPLIIDYLVNSEICPSSHFGISGVSMGGYIAYTAVTIDSRIKVAAPLISSPHYKEDQEKSPDSQLEKFKNIYLLSQTAGLDTTVPPHEAREFHKILNEKFPCEKEQYRYIEYPNSEHMLREEDWSDAIDEMVEWFHKYL